MEQEQTAVERIYEQLELGNWSVILDAKDLLLRMEQVDLKIAYERGVLEGLLKSVNKQ